VAPQRPVLRSTACSRTSAGRHQLRRTCQGKLAANASVGKAAVGEDQRFQGRYGDRPAKLVDRSAARYPCGPASRPCTPARTACVTRRTGDDDPRPGHAGGATDPGSGPAGLGGAAVGSGTTMRAQAAVLPGQARRQGPRLRPHGDRDPLPRGTGRSPSRRTPRTVGDAVRRSHVLHVDVLRADVLPTEPPLSPQVCCARLLRSDLRRSGDLLPGSARQPP
jgi:hypothetical protein